MNVDKYTYTKIAHLKIKSIIIAEIRDLNFHIVEKKKKEYEV